MLICNQFLSFLQPGRLTFSALWRKVMVGEPNRKDMIDIIHGCYPSLESISAKLIGRCNLLLLLYLLCCDCIITSYMYCRYLWKGQFAGILPVWWAQLSWRFIWMSRAKIFLKVHIPWNIFFICPFIRTAFTTFIYQGPAQMVQENTWSWSQLQGPRIVI